MIKSPRARAWIERAVRVAERVVPPLGYLCLLLAGLAALVAPPASVAESVGPLTAVTWGATMVGGATLGLFGHVLRWPYPEAIGAPLTFSAVLLYGSVLLVRQWSIPGLASSGTVAAWLILGLSIGFILNRLVWLLGEAVRQRAAS